MLRCIFKWVIVTKQGHFYQIIVTKQGYFRQNSVTKQGQLPREMRFLGAVVYGCELHFKLIHSKEWFM